MRAIEITEKKNNKKELSYKEIEYMINSYVKGKINDETMSDFVWSIYYNGLNIEETYFIHLFDDNHYQLMKSDYDFIILLREIKK